MGGDKDLMGGDSRVIRDNFPRPTIKGKIRYQDDNIGLKQSLIVRKPCSDVTLSNLMSDVIVLENAGMTAYLSGLTAPNFVAKANHQILLQNPRKIK